MPDPKLETLLQSVTGPEGGEVQTAVSLAARLPGFSLQAIEEALRMLCLSGVLERKTLPDGSVGYRYAHPERYRLAGASDLRQPGPDFGKK
jgi:hypothetical protein